MNVKNKTPEAQRLHIVITGAANSGKSSLLNALTGQHTSVVSSTKGTTTDPVKKPMELHGTGPVIFVDTAGFGDSTELSALRTEKTLDAIRSADMIICVFSADTCYDEKAGDTGSPTSLSWFKLVNESGKKIIPVLSKCDLMTDSERAEYVQKIIRQVNTNPVFFSTVQNTEKCVSALLEKIAGYIPQEFLSPKTFTGNLCTENESVLLVTPQDIEAPKGRLILPQVQVLRELLDKKCLVSCCTADKVEETLSTLKQPPSLIITDSQAFKTVYAHKPVQSLLTSFSILMAAQKGDISKFREGAYAIANLKKTSRVLIAEACTHVPLEEDIGRVKIPAMLKKRIPGINIDFVRGTDFPELKPFPQGKNAAAPYDLIIHCGACIHNSSYVQDRQKRAALAGIPMTNYGLAIAFLTGILDDVAIPE